MAEEGWLYSWGYATDWVDSCGYQSWTDSHSQNQSQGDWEEAETLSASSSVSPLGHYAPATADVVDHARCPALRKFDLPGS